MFTFKKNILRNTPCLGWAVREAPCRTTLLTPYDVNLAVRVYGCSVREAPLPFGVYGGYLSVRGAQSGVRAGCIERLTLCNISRHRP